MLALSIRGVDLGNGALFRRLSERNRRRLLLRSRPDLFRPIRHAKCKLLWAGF